MTDSERSGLQSAERPAGGRARGVGGRARRRRPCWPTGAPTSSRWSRRRAIRCATCSGRSGIGGDDFPNPAFAQDNRGKRSVVLDLRQPEARRPARSSSSRPPTSSSRNLRPDALDGLGLEPEATVARHPRLVYCSISGYGLRGRGPQPPGLRHRRLLGPLRPVGPDGHQRRRGAAQRPRRHRRPHHRPGRAGRAPGRGARAAPDRARPGGRGVAPAHRRLRPRVGPGPAGHPGQGGAGPRRGTGIRPR